MTFLVLPILSKVPVTFAPSIYGTPIVVSFPLSHNRTLSKVTLSPGFNLPEIFSTTITSPTDTRYCLPPVSMTANSSDDIGLIFYILNRKRQIQPSDIIHLRHIAVLTRFR